MQIYFLLFIMYSFIGWVMEVFYCYWDMKKLTNRGFLIGPICPIYGVGSLLIILFLRQYQNQPIILFILAILICSFLEYLTSYVLEKVFKVRWWDYSNKKYNINGRICLETMVPFGIIGTLLVYYINPFFLNLLKMINLNILNIIFYIIFLIFIADLIISLKIISNIKFITSNIIKDNTEEVNQKIKERIVSKLKSFKNKLSADKKIRKILSEQSYFTRRILDSFPKFKINILRKNKKDDKNGK